MKTLFKTICWLIILCIIGAIGYVAYGRIEKYIYPLKYQNYVQKYSSECNIDESLVYAMIKCESGYDQNAVSSVGAIGLMQLTPETFEWILTKYDNDGEYTADDLYTPEVNIHAGCHLIARHIEEFGSLREAIAAYHAGRGKVNEWLKNPEYSADGKTLDTIPYTETSSYVDKVIKSIEKYQNIYNIQ